MKVVTAYNNFARAKVDHDMMGRFDLPIYNTGADVFQNMFSNFKGNAIFRTGFEDMVFFEDCRLHEFKFSNNQNYILVFYANKIRFLSYDANNNFGWVLSGGVPLEVATTYTLAQCKELKFTQNADVMVITHGGNPSAHSPKDLKRTAANAFTFTDHVFSDAGGSPFNAANFTITAVTKANPAVVTFTAAPRDGDLVTISGVVGMTQLNGNTYTIKRTSATQGQLVGIDSTGYTTYTSGGVAARAASYPTTCLFYKARLYFGRFTTIWGSAQGNYNSFDLPTTNTDTSPLQFTIADITQPIEWLFGGDNSLIAGSADGLVAINGGSVNAAITANTVEANITSADGCNGAEPLRKDGFIFYVGRNNRNIYYFSYDLLTESFQAKDANFISYDITDGNISKIRYKKDRNDLIYCRRDDGDFVSLNFKAEESIVGWHSHDTNGIFKDEVVITDNLGNPELFALIQRPDGYYIERLSKPVEFAQRIQFFTGDEEADRDAYNNYLGQQLRDCIYLDGANVVQNLQTGNQITYDSGAGTLSALLAVFAPGDVGKHVSYKTITGYEVGRFEITGYTSSTVVSVSVLQDPTQDVWTGDWYLSFSAITGMSQYDGQTIGIVTDGGYLQDVTVSGSSVTLDQQTLIAVVGYKYKGLIKSFCLGFQAGAQNTQTTMKAISRVGIRTVASAGCKFGSSPYRMNPVQHLSQSDLNYLPPLPMDGTTYISYVDENELDKYYYVAQDEPLPLTITSVMIEANYS